MERRSFLKISGIAAGSMIIPVYGNVHKSFTLLSTGRMLVCVGLYLYRLTGLDKCFKNFSEPNERV